MKKRVIILLLLTICIAGCRKSVPQVGTDETPAMTFHVDMHDTKSLVTADNIRTEGNRFYIYDVHTRKSPLETDYVAGEGLVQYLDKQSLKYTGGKWTFTDNDGDETDIPWTKRGTHNFIAYNDYDASSAYSLPVSVGYTSFNNDPTNNKFETDQYLNVSTWQLTLENQFDFIYASASRDMMASLDPDEKYAPVEMLFKHLFSSVSFNIVVSSSEKIYLTYFNISGLYDKGTAKIDFGGDVLLSLSKSKEASFLRIPAADIPSGGSYLIYKDVGNVGTEGSFLMWPHSRSDFADVAFEIRYRLGGSAGKEITASGKLSDSFAVNNWSAGNRYSYNIYVSDEYVTFDVVKVVDWINDDVIIDER